MAFIRPRLRTFLFAWLACLFLATSSWADQPEFSSGQLGQGKPWETEWYQYDSGVDGPVVMIFGGVHGNEPAGSRAAMQIKNWTVEKGKLIVVPRANKLGLQANTRWIPEFRNDRKLKDLNRNFPRQSDPTTKTELATALWEFIKERQPDWFFDLHEGYDFHRVNPKSVGSSVIAFPEQAELANQLASVANRHIAPERAFSILAKSGPVDGSAARACSVQLGAKSFILETTFKDQPISQRTRQHRAMVATALQAIGVTDRDLSQQFVSADQNKKEPIRVGVFDADGAGPDKIFRVLDAEPTVEGFHIGPEDISVDVLDQFDVLLFPGGSGSKQGKAIGPQRRELVRQFTRDGGGVIGICAGAYLCSSHYDWSLNLMNAKVYNVTVEIPEKGRKSMWYRGGPADVEVEMSERAGKLLGLDGQHTIRYQNGPIISPGSSETAPDYEVLASFRSENYLYEVQKGTMTDQPAILRSKFGQGEVIAFSPHFESTQGKESVVVRAIRHVAAPPAETQPEPDLGTPAWEVTDAPFRWDVTTRTDPNQVGQFEITVQLQMAPGWHTYANQVPGSPYRPTVVQLQLPDQVEAVGPWQKPVALPDLAKPEQQVYRGTVRFSRKVRLLPGAKRASVTVQVDYQVCDQAKCLPAATVKKTVRIGDGS
ncbi:MAG: succinylglutamate desuccinylase/aspartoacylase family protein [Mariniblastus sp.]|nr:succinylglutamate desuccinylase/aspartoacylase family protein [Mariniblastus sp.]